MGICCMAQETQKRVSYQPGGGRGADGAGDGIKFQKGGDICLPMTDSCWGLTENSKTL